MAGLFSNEGDVMSNIMQRRQQANQALGSPYGKYGGIVQAGGMFADVGADAAAGGGYGAADPRMQQQKELKQIAAVVAQQFPGKTDSPEFYKALALAVQDKYPQKAQEAIQMAVEKEKQRAEMRKVRQEERDAQDVITGRVNILKSQGFSPDDAQRIARDDVTYKEMIASKKSDANLGLSTNQRIAAKSLGFPVYTDINKYTTEQAQAIEKKMNEQANSVAKNGAVTVTIEDKGSLKGAEELGKLDAKQVDEWRKAGDQAEKALSNLDRMEKAAIGGVYSGPQAGSTLVIANFLDSLGLLQGEALEKLTRSASYDKTAKESVLQAIGGSLGNQVSDADRKFIEAIVPQLATNPQAKIELIRVMKHINEQAQEKSRVSSEWFYNNNYSLRGFQWKSKPYAPYSDLSDEELDAQIKAAQAAQGVPQ